MATPRIGSFGTKLALDIRQGATFGPHYLELKQEDGTDVNLTGSTFRAQIRRKALDANPVVATITCTIDVAVGAPGAPARVKFTMTDETTAAIPAGEQPTESASQYVWDMEWEDSLGNVLPVAYGPVTVLREVTRP